MPLTALLLFPLLYLLWWLALSILAARKPPLRPWHLTSLRELGAADYPPEMTFEELESKEKALFESLTREVYDQVAAEDRDAYNRYHSQSLSDPAAFSDRHGLARDDNRSFVLEPPGEPRGAVLLAHGLTDSPYSLRAIAEVLRQQGCYVLGRSPTSRSPSPRRIRCTAPGAAGCLSARWPRGGKSRS